ncbi:MAG: EscV/YscV/HrcV family type III secretion system export apparatus protein [Ottowia sp.]|nr:EscV/YscV/HrcV family type III secretion system export apparatus protein [Ottowia sp.]
MKQLSKLLALATQRQDVILAVLLLVAVLMMIVPLPTPLVDVLIAINLSFSIVLLMVAIYLRDPLEFSAFPSALLITTLYRLALTISTSRLILLQHDAGEIVYAFGQFAVSGNLVVGIIIFSIITIVQFIVITKGSERVAEVGARFSLDGMPGKQMSIDGDMRAGIIDANEARRQRRLVQKESQLYGAMDGAMKFVKGDAIASIIVIIVNLLGGITIGVFMQNMSAGDAAMLYGVLSIGDGLIAQIPSLLISVTAGIIVTRVPGEQRKNLAKELGEQVGAHPQALTITATVLLIFAVIPGFPTLVFLLLAGLIFAGLWWGRYQLRQAGGGVVQTKTQTESGEADSKGGTITMDPGATPLRLVLAQNIYRGAKLSSKLDEMRQKKFEQLGIPLPEIQLETSTTLSNGTLRILLYHELVSTVVFPEGLALVDSSATKIPQAVHTETLAMNGTTLQWVERADIATLAVMGVATYQDEASIAHCVSLAIDRYAAEFIGVQETRFLMDAMESRYSELVKELQRQLPIGKIANVLQRLVEENISIRDLRAIFEALIEWAPKEKDLVMLTEYARLGLRRHIIERNRHGQPWIRCWMLGDAIENTVRESIRQTSVGTYSSLEPTQNQAILKQIRMAIESADSQYCVVLATMDVRRFVRKIIERELFNIPVLSYQEVGEEAQLKVLGNIDAIGLVQEEE